MYHLPAKSGWHIIGDKKIFTDSKSEAAFIQWLDKNGFLGLWERRQYGISVGKFNYTPDVELSVQFNGMTHRALVEYKPQHNSEFSKDARRRMAGISKHYHTEVLLLYVGKVKKWYRLDKKTLELSECEMPTPGEIPIDKLYKPITLPTRNIYGKAYGRKPELAKGALGFFIGIVDEVVRGPKKRKK